MCLGDKFDHAEECLCLLSEINLFSPLLSSLIFGVQQTTRNRKTVYEKKNLYKASSNRTCNVVDQLQSNSIKKCQIFAAEPRSNLKKQYVESSCYGRYLVWQKLFVKIKHLQITRLAYYTVRPVYYYSFVKIRTGSNRKCTQMNEWKGAGADCWEEM